MTTITTGEFVVPSLIENTTMQEILKDGILYGYFITPIEGYVLHDKNYDNEIVDFETDEPTGEVSLGYRTSKASVMGNYDFVVNTRELYAIPKEFIPEEQLV